MRWPARTRCAALGACRAVDRHPAVLDQLLQVRARELGRDRDEHLVQSLAVLRAVDHGDTRLDVGTLDVVAVGIRADRHRAREGDARPYNIRDPCRRSRAPFLTCLHEYESLVPAHPDRSVGDLDRRRPDRLRHDKSRRLDADWTPESLYSEAKEEAASGNYEKAIKLYERLEGRAAGTMLAQQAQIERAYYLWKSGEKAQALSTLERFIKLHPTSPALDYALYLQGLVNFNDDLGLFGNLASQDLSERDQQASRDSYQSFKPARRAVPAVGLRRGCARAHELHRQLARRLRGARRALLLPPRCLRGGRQPGAARRAGVPAARRRPRRRCIILAQSYDRLGLVELRDDTERVLKANYPEHRLSTPI